MPITRRAFLLGSLMLPGWQGRVLASDPGGPLASDGGSGPMYAAVHSPAFYDAGLNRTFIAWEAWHGGRTQQVTSLDHSTGYFSPIEGMGRSFLVDDEHGNPSIVLDHEDHLHAFYGAHANIEGHAQRHSSTRWPWDGTELGGSKWAVREILDGKHNYPHPVMVGSTMYVFARNLLGGPSPSDFDSRVAVFKTASLSDGLATWESPVDLITFGTDSRVYQGTAIVVGTDVHFVCAKATGGDTIRQHIYYMVYDTLTGALCNHDKSFSVASGDLPMDLTEANSNCRIFEHASGNGGYVPVLAFDTNGDPFVAMSDGATPDYDGGTSYDIKVMKRSSGTWGSPETVANTDNRFNDFAIGPLAGGAMELFWNADPAAAWPARGDIMRKVRSSGGTWGSAETILEATTYALGSLNMVRNAHANARVTFCEMPQSDADGEYGARIYCWGAQGLVKYRQAPAAGEAETTADGNELREDNSMELREDDANELREVPD